LAVLLVLLVAAIPSNRRCKKQTLIKLYAAKHNPFVYFQSVQEGHDPRNSLKNVVGFSGAHGLYADLASGDVPSLAFIAPNQCNDQHGRDNAGPQCDFDPNDNGTQAGLNPALISLGDQTVQILVEAIHASPAWKDGRSAIVVLWDENDYAPAPITDKVLANFVNRVLFIVETNFGDSDDRGVRSHQFYTHFSLLKSLESAFGLSCLNHACDRGVHVMADVFGGR
jgi:phosphatidylinositol-3-phosphatase